MVEQAPAGTAIIWMSLTVWVTLFEKRTQQSKTQKKSVCPSSLQPPHMS